MPGLTALNALVSVVVALCFRRTPSGRAWKEASKKSSDGGMKWVARDRMGWLAGAVASWVGLGAGCGLLIPGAKTAAAARPAARQLEFYNLHTGGSLRGCIGRAVTTSLMLWTRSITCCATSVPVTCAASILPFWIWCIACASPWRATSRSRHLGVSLPATNAMLARRSNGVAKNSYHVKGMAIDLRLGPRPQRSAHGADARRRRRRLLPESDFVHMDTGPVRSW